jgi:hypothetical protein
MSSPSDDYKKVLEIDPNLDLAHITSEIYRKNIELAYSNKTLSVLRKIDDIILSSVTDPIQVAQQVANAVIPEVDYKLVTIFLFDQVNNMLFPLAISQTEPMRELEKQINKNIINLKIDGTDKRNIVAEAVRSKTPQVTNNANEIYNPFPTNNEWIHHN